MKRWIAIVLLGCAASFGWAAENLPPAFHEIKDFHCGVDTYHSSLAIDDCYVQDALNVYFDKEWPFVKRGGYTTFVSTKSYSYSGTWSYTDSSSNVWLIARSSDAIVATTGIGNSFFTVQIATVSANNVVNSVNAFGNAYFVDQTQGVFYWNGSSTTYVSGSPRGSLIAQFHNRVWVSGLAVPLGNYLYGSKFLDGTVWSTGINANDPVLIQIALNDNFDNISALWAGYNDILYVFKNYSIHGVYGFDQSDFQTRQITGEAGCIDQRSIQFFLGGLVFASARGIEAFDGYTPVRISDQIKNKVDPFTANSSFNQNSWSQQNATDWAAGSISNGAIASLSTTLSPPSLTLSTGTTGDITAANFSAGTLSNTFVTGGKVYISTNNAGNITNPDFESAFSGNWTNSGSGGQTITQNSGSGLNCGTISPQTGSNDIALRNLSLAGLANVYFESIDTSGNLLQQNTMTTGNLCSWTQYASTPTAANVGKRVKFRLHINDTSGDKYATTSDSYIWGGPISFYFNSGCTGANCAVNINWNFFDNITLGSSTITSGTFTSRTFDTGLSSAIVNVAISSTSATEAIGLMIRHSVASVGPFKDLTTVQNVSVKSNRYLQYLATFTVTGADDAQSTLNSSTFSFVASSGVFSSQSHNISTATAFGNLTVNQTLSGGGNITWNVCTANNAAMTGKSCSVTNANGSITVSTNVYAQAIASFTVTATTDVATLQNFTINWLSGTRKPPMASVVYDNRYWLSVTTDTTDSYNDATLVLSKGPIWTIFDVQAGSFVLWKNNLYFGNTTATGYVNQLEQGYADNGAAINAFVKTKDYAPGGIISDKFFSGIYLVADNLGAYNIYTNYFIDRSTVAFTLGNVSQNETPGTLITRLNFPIDSTHQNFGKTISFKFQQNDANAPIRFFGGALEYRARKPI